MKKENWLALSLGCLVCAVLVFYPLYKTHTLQKTPQQKPSKIEIISVFKDYNCVINADGNYSHNYRMNAELVPCQRVDFSQANQFGFESVLVPPDADAAAVVSSIRSKVDRDRKEDEASEQRYKKEEELKNELNTLLK